MEERRVRRNSLKLRVGQKTVGRYRSPRCSAAAQSPLGGPAGSWVLVAQHFDFKTLALQARPGVRFGCRSLEDGNQAPASSLRRVTPLSSMMATRSSLIREREEPLTRLGFLLMGVILGLVGLVADGASSDAVPPRISTPAEVGYSVEHWTVEEGLPGRIITSLAQTPDGALWCGSPDGLARFDGTHFTMLGPDQSPALRGIRVLELRCDSGGRLWIEDIEGALVVLENGRFRRITELDGLPLTQGGKLGEVEGGGFWVKGRTDNRFYQDRAGRFEAVTYPNVPSSEIDRFIADASGVRWGVHEGNRALVRILGAGSMGIQPLVAPDGRSRVQAGRFFQLRDRRWAVTSSFGIYALQGEQWGLLHSFTRPQPDFDSHTVLDGVEDWSGNFWVSIFDLGLVVSGPDQAVTGVALPDSSAKPFLRTMLMGREGNIWVGGNDGLYRLRRYPFRSQPPGGERRRQPVVGIVEDANQAIWVLHRDGWERLNPSGWQSSRNPDSHAVLWAGCASRDSSVILGYTTHGDSDQAFANRVFPDGSTQSMGTLEGIVRVMLESRSGQLWVGTEVGLWRWDGGRFVRVEIPGSIGAFPVFGLAEDRRGRMVVGSHRSGLWRREETGEWKRLTAPSDTAGIEIWGIDLDDDDTLWVATDAGVARWRQGSWHSFGAGRGELPRLARSVVRDGQQGLWVASQFGVVRVDLDGLPASIAQKDEGLGSDWFDRSDGLPSVSCADEQGALLKGSDGRIWVGTLAGAAVVNPADWRVSRRRMLPPSVAISAVLVDDKPVLQPSLLTRQIPFSEAVIQPTAQRVEFDYDVVDLTPNPRTRLRYRLAGFDHEWRDAGTQRRAAYHNPPPGKYTFQVMAANRYGQSALPLASATIRVEPHYWQTAWFRVIAGALLIGALWLTRLMTLRQTRRERLRREELSLGLIQSQEAERKRIARELHDSLGQDLILIRNAAKLTLRRLSPTPAVSEHLNQVAELASHALTNARAITSNLRPPELDRLGLTAALEAMVEAYSMHSEVELTARIENANGLWSADQEIHVYRLVQESLNNALKHASPRHIQVSVSVKGPEVLIVVEDDGCGFDPHEPSAQRSGIGLPGLRERVRILSGVMELSSTRGKGTIFRCRIPISAYGKQREDPHSNRG